MARPDPPSTLTDLTGRQLAMLARLAEIGMEVAEAAGRQAREGRAAPADGPDPALSFARAARAVRLTIALETRLVTERAAADRAEAARRRDRIHTRVERVAEAKRTEADEVEALASAAWESLTETDDAELLDRPIEQVVARICADLGLAAVDFDLPPPSASRPPPPLRRGGVQAACPAPLRSGGLIPGGDHGRRSLTEGASCALAPPPA